MRAVRYYAARRLGIISRAYRQQKFNIIYVHNYYYEDKRAAWFMEQIAFILWLRVPDRNRILTKFTFTFQTLVIKRKKKIVCPSVFEIFVLHREKFMSHQ